MIKYEELYNIVKEKLSEKRWLHTQGVIKRAIEYAEIYSAEKEEVMLAALAHDIAKELPKEEQEKYIEKYRIELDEIEKLNPNLLHSKIGAAICKYELDFTDDMINAVMYHTTGRANMSLLEKIIYLADATDENRAYPSLPHYVEMIRNDIDKGVMEVSKWVIKDLLEKNRMIHINSIECYNYYVENKRRD